MGRRPNGAYAMSAAERQRRYQERKAREIAANFQTNLPEPVLARLAKLLGMLGSNSTGERDNAARMIEKLRQEAGMSWDEILNI